MPSWRLLLLVLVLGLLGYVIGKVAAQRRIFLKFPHQPTATFVCAVLEGREDEARAMLREVNVNHSGYDGMTPLILAVDEKNQRAVHFLLESGANPNQENDEGFSALAHAAWMEDSWYLSELLSYKGNPNQMNEKRQTTPLVQAISARRIHNVELLIAAGADPLFRLNSGASCLAYAVELQAYSIALILLQAGADPNVPDALGRTIYDFMAHEGFSMMNFLYHDRDQFVQYLQVHFPQPAVPNSGAK